MNIYVGNLSFSVTEEDLRTIANNGMMIGAGFFTGGGA